jgi:hypothetical protein
MIDFFLQKLPKIKNLKYKKSYDLGENPKSPHNEYFLPYF